MQLSHAPRTRSAVFDDPNLVSSSGLVPVLTLARTAGLHELADKHLSVPTDKGANAGLKVASLVAGMVAGVRLPAGSWSAGSPTATRAARTVRTRCSTLGAPTPSSPPPAPSTTTRWPRTRLTAATRSSNGSVALGDRVAWLIVRPRWIRWRAPAHRMRLELGGGLVRRWRCRSGRV